MIILDRGHGVDTPGKRSPVWDNGTQLFEWEFNTVVVDMIYHKLSVLGINSLKLVDFEKDLSLSKRVQIVNRIASMDKDAFLVSIHGNAAGVEKASGWEIYTSPGQTKSDILADYIYVEAEKSGMFKMRKDTSDGDNDKESRFYILTKTICPAVLTENGFFTNYKECQKMLTDEYRNIVADIHVEGILKYLNNK